MMKMRRYKGLFLFLPMALSSAMPSGAADASRNKAERAKRIREKEANKQNNKKWTATLSGELAKGKPDLDQVEKALKNGANPLIQTSQLKKYYYVHAVEKGNLGVLALFLMYGVDLAREEEASNLLAWAKKEHSDQNKRRVAGLVNIFYQKNGSSAKGPVTQEAQTWLEETLILIKQVKETGAMDAQLDVRLGVGRDQADSQPEPSSNPEEKNDLPSEEVRPSSPHGSVHEDGTDTESFDDIEIPLSLWGRVGGWVSQRKSEVSFVVLLLVVCLLAWVGIRLEWIFPSQEDQEDQEDQEVPNDQGDDTAPAFLAEA